MADDMRVEYNAEVIRLATVLQSVPVAAIAFAMHETADRDLAWSLVPIAAAVLVWGLGFAAGIENSRARQRAYKQAMLEQHLREAGDPARAGDVHGDFERSQSRLHITHAVSVWTILLGALLYAGGHGWHLAEASAAKSAQATASPVQGRGGVTTPNT